MSSPLDRAVDRDGPLPYAPKWAGKVASERRGIARLVTDDDFGDKTSEPDEVAGETEEQSEDHGLVIDRFRVPRSLEPTVLAEPLEPSAKPVFGMLVRLGAAVAAATIVALLVIGKGPSWTFVTTERVAQAASPPIALRSVAPATSAAVPSKQPRLVMAPGAPRAADDLIPLGISLENPDDGSSVIVAGLPAGTSITTGRRVTANSWRLSTADLADATVRPPQGFVGAVNLAVELRRADDSTVDRQELHLEWTGTPAKIAAPATTRSLDPEEIVRLVKRGQQLIGNGDVAAGRLFLQRAAEAQDPRAALMLAMTYDPIVIEQVGIRGVVADADTARNWYQKAKEFGSAEASRRLEMLASRER